MTTYLDLEAALSTSFVHPGGAWSTEYVLAGLHLEPGERALDLGCGTGATTAEARRLGVMAVGLDLRAAMLAAAHRRDATLPLVQADAGNGLPFGDAVFHSVWAESVVALLNPRLVVPEMVRVLRPGGAFALNERIWRAATTVAEATTVNRRSQQCFGIPAAATDPLDRDDWVALINESGIVLREVAPVDFPQAPRLGWREFLTRQHRYLSSPIWLPSSLRWRWLIRRHRKAWARLESWLFIGEKAS